MSIDPGHTARLLARCADRPGLVAAISGFLFAAGANIVESQQHSTDPAGGTFFLRTAFHLPGIASPSQREAFERAFAAEVAEPHGMEWRLRGPEDRPRVAIMASHEGHCLRDLLWRRMGGELDAEIVAVISNHRDLEHEVAAFGVPYHHIPVSRDTKPDAERRLLELLRERVDLVVLARYMQILSGGFLAELDRPVINIHHSFLPAFPGAQPYRRARERGVKIIGATAHYVTEDLDAGPIIEQDVARVDHAHTVADFERVGRDTERVVLARAVLRHLDDRVIVDGQRTVVF
jgi:formyltetrahydrofolate deformylase